MSQDNKGISRTLQAVGPTTPPPPSSKSESRTTGRHTVDRSFEFGPGVQVGEYIVEAKIGEGGMGEVWKAKHPVIGKQVALKVLNKDFIANKEVISRFIQEAKAVNEIRHRNMIDIFSFGDLPDGRPYFAMEFLEGQTLSKYIKSKNCLAFREILDVFGQMCRAIQAAHDRGIIHRDLKPDNIFLMIEDESTPPFVKVLDFGIAKLASGSGSGEGQHLTRTGAIFGTPAYMSPEQCEGAKAVDLRSDIYALGIILFEMIVGRTPFAEPGEGLGTILMKQMTMPAPAPSACVRGRKIPPALDAVLQKVLAKSPEARHTSCTELLADLRRAIGNIQEDESALASVVVTVGAKKSPTGGFGEQQNSYYTSGNKTGQDLGQAGTGRGKQLAAVAVLLLGIVGGALYALSGGSNTTTATNTSLATATPTSNTTPPTSVAANPVTKMVAVVLDSTPTGANVFLDNKLLGVTPIKTNVDAGTSEVSLRVEKEGFETLEERVTLSADLNKQLSLKKLETKPTTAVKTPTTKNPITKTDSKTSKTGKTGNTSTNVDKDDTIKPVW